MKPSGTGGFKATSLLTALSFSPNFRSMPEIKGPIRILKWVCVAAACVQGFGGGEAFAQPAAKALPAGKSEVSETLDLETCFKLSAVRSDTLAISEQEIRAANARYQQAISALFPTVTFNSQQFFQNKAATTVTGGRFIGGSEYSSQNAINVSQPLFMGFQDFNQAAANRAETEARQFDLQRNYQTLYQDVATAFYQIVQNERDLDILADLKKALEGRVAELNRRVDLGRSRPAELLQARSDLATVKVTIEQTKGLRNAARESLAFYIGRPAQSFQLKDTMAFPGPQELEAYLKEIRVRPDILAALAEQRQARRLLSVAKGELLPQATVDGTYYLSEDPASTQEYAFTFNISLPLFDGGLIIGKIREQKDLYRRSELNVQQLMRTADQDVRTAFSDFNASVAQVLQLREAELIAMESYKAQLEDYPRGVVSNLDVLTALQSVSNSKRDLLSSDINAKLNLIKLHVAAGRVKQK